MSLISFLLPLPLSGCRLSLVSFLKIVLCFPNLSLVLQIIFIVLGLSRRSALKAKGDKILTAFPSTLWRRTFVLEAPWWHTGNSSLIKRPANSCLNYCTERMKWLCKRWPLEEYMVGVFVCLFLKAFLWAGPRKCVAFTHASIVNYSIELQLMIIYGLGSLAGLTDGRALLNLVQVALFNKHRKEWIM